MKKILLLLTVIGFVTISYAQHAADLDPSFGTNGIVKTGIGSPFNYTLYGKQVLVQPDGSMYIILEANDITIIAKKHADGSPDISYGNNGYSTPVPVYFNQRAILQTDAKIVIVGGTKSLSDDRQDFTVARFNTDGRLDSTFNKDGIKVSRFGGGDLSYTSDLAIQPDGKIVVVGNSVFLNDFSQRFFEVARFNKDGSIDSTFDQDGSLTLELDEDEANAVAIQADGKIVVVGDYQVVRCNPNGSMDFSFNKTGVQNIEPDNYFVVSNSVALQKDGKIIVGGYVDSSYLNTSFVLVRFNTDGTFDKTFDSDGKQTTNFGLAKDFAHNATSISLQNDGKIFLLGYTDGDNKIAIARYAVNGSLDNSYSGDGKNIINFDFSGHSAEYATLQADGKLLALGYSENATSLYVTRFNINGTLDNSFGGDGIVTDHINQGDTHYTCTALQTDGKIIAAGYSWNGSNYDFAVVRYNLNGSLDLTFSGDGKLITDFFSSNDKANGVAIQSDGKIVVVGSAGNNFGVVRYNKDGTLDNSFDGDGKLTTDFGSDDFAMAVIMQSDGKILVGGSALARYNANGSPDVSFHKNGKVSIPFNGNAISLQNNGKIIIAGGNEIARYKIDGSPDNTFGDNGTQYYDQWDDLGNLKSLAIQNDGKIIAAGYYEYIDKASYSSSILLRINTDGTIDESFSENGLPHTFNGLDYATSVALQSDNKIILAGYGADDFTIVRYNTDGSLDKTFGESGIKRTAPGQADDKIAGIAIANNRLYAAGDGQYPGYFGVVAKYLLAENKAPAVKITTPVNNTTYSAPATITLSATASDADGTIDYVQFYNNGTLLKTDSTSPYSYTINNAAAGNYSFVAKASDNNGVTGNAASAAVLVTTSSNKAPAVSITSPVNDATYAAHASIIINATAADPDGTVKSVNFYDGSTLLKSDSSSPYNYTLANAAAGNYKFYVKATDTKGLATTSETVSVFAGAAQTNKTPVVKLSGPANNTAYTAPANFTLNATASDADGTITSVQFYNNGKLIFSDNTSPYSYAINNLPAGSYSLVAKATDNNGFTNNSASVTVNVFTQANKAPEVTIDNPVNNSIYYTPANIVFKANATDSDGISNVAFYDGAILLKADSTSPYNYTLNNAAAGNYSFTAKATDEKGLFSSSEAVHVTVIANKAPVINISAYPDVSVAPANITIYAEASDSDGTIKNVQFYNGTTLLNTDSTDIDFYSFSWKNVPAGTYSVTARATDNRGLTISSEIIAITVLPNGTLEAEEAVLSGAKVDSSAQGFTGSGYADYIHASGDFIEWTVNAATAAPFSLKFRYANAGPSNRPLKLQVNGVTVKASQDFLSTESWTNWSLSSVTANLIAGTNKIRLTTIGFNGPNVDNLSVIANTGTLEAEESVLSGAVVASGSPGFKGLGYADYVNESGDYIEWTVNAATAGPFSLQFRYANGGKGNRPLKAEVNQAVVKASLNFLPTGAWASWYASSITANLVAGINTIRLTTIGFNGPNVDYLAFSKNTSTRALKNEPVSSNNILPASPYLLKAFITPNPVANNAKLILSAASDLPVTLRLIDMLGRSFKAFKFLPAGSKTFAFSTKDLLPGSYIIIVKQGNANTHARLIVVKG